MKLTSTFKNKFFFFACMDLSVNIVSIRGRSLVFHFFYFLSPTNYFVCVFLLFFIFSTQILIWWFKFYIFLDLDSFIN
jgi:hypothetical protein